jgi:hypothetical protein
MITIKKISKTEIPALVEMSYVGDDELIDKYHHLCIEGKPTREFAVLASLHRIHEASQETKLNYYKVIFQKKPIGYFVTFDNVLYSFCINKKYRNKENLIGWFNQVKKTLGKPFQCILSTHNTRAIDHLIKQGMVRYRDNEEDKVTTLVYY